MSGTVLFGDCCGIELFAQRHLFACLFGSLPAVLHLYDDHWPVNCPTSFNLRRRRRRWVSAHSKEANFEKLRMQAVGDLFCLEISGSSQQSLRYNIRNAHNLHLVTLLQFYPTTVKQLKGLHNWFYGTRHYSSVIEFLSLFALFKYMSNQA